MKRKMMIDKKKVFMAVGVLLIGLAGIIACSTINEYLFQLRQAHEKEFTERTALWNLSKNMTAKEMLSRMTTVAKGDSVLVCKISRIPIGAYSDFMQETAKPTRRAWVRIREAHMESLINGVDWMEKRSREMPFSSYVLCSKSKYDEQGNSRPSFLNEKVGRERNSTNCTHQRYIRKRLSKTGKIDTSRCSPLRILEAKESFHTILRTFRRKHCYRTIQA